MTVAELKRKIFEKCHNGDCRLFFKINDRYSGYLSRDKQLYFVLDGSNNTYADYTEAQLEVFLASLDGPGNINSVTETVSDKISNFTSGLTMFDSSKVKTGLILLGALGIGLLIINKKF